MVIEYKMASQISQMSSNILDLQQYADYVIKIENLCRALTYHYIE